MSTPSKRISPPAIRPGGMGMRRMTEEAVTLFPQADSPDEAQGLPRVDRDAHIVDRLQDAAADVEDRS